MHKRHFDQSDHLVSHLSFCTMHLTPLMSAGRIGAMKVLLVLTLVQLAFSFELTDPEWVAFKVSNRRSHVRSSQGMGMIG